MPSHDLTDKLKRLYRLHAFGIKFGLEAEQALLELLSNPQRGMKFIHVAGTNGKGSVCALVESVLRAAGFKTGLYTSPHLVRVNERIKVNGQDIPDEELAPLIELVDKHARAYREGGGPAAPRAGISADESVATERDGHLMSDSLQNGREITFFEFLTALAFEYFRRQKVEIAVLETGMGGRLDATNVITPEVSVVTGISLEHTGYLGTTLSAIAAEKGGIIKANVPVVIGALPEEALGALQKIAREKNASLIRAGEIVTVARKSQSIDGQKICIESANNSYGTVPLPLLGAHQLENAAIAVAALEEFCRVNDIDLSPAAVKKGFASVSWPGRLQVISKNPVTIIDGAHNPEAAAVLNAALKELFEGKPVFLVLGMSSDKDVAGFARNMTIPVKHCRLVQFANERSIPPAQLAGFLGNKGWKISTATTVEQALQEAKKEAEKQGGIVCVAGSLFLAGEVLAPKQAGSQSPCLK